MTQQVKRNNGFPLLEAFLCVHFREAMGMVLHRDSKWYQQWKDFKDNNLVFNRKEEPISISFVVYLKSAMNVTSTSINSL